MTNKKSVLYSFKAVGKDGKLYKNFVLSWMYNGKKYRLYVKPCFYKDLRLMGVRSVGVKDYDAI